MSNKIAKCNYYNYLYYLFKHKLQQNFFFYFVNIEHIILILINYFHFL